MSLPTDRDERNALPVWDGCISYWPDIWAEIAKVSVAGNKQHRLGAKLHWDTTVSTDHANKVLRHMLDDAAGQVMDTDGTFHLAKAIWRLNSMLQLRIWARDGKDEHGQPKRKFAPPDPYLFEIGHAVKVKDNFYRWTVTQRFHSSTGNKYDLHARGTELRMRGWPESDLSEWPSE